MLCLPWACGAMTNPPTALIRSNSLHCSAVRRTPHLHSISCSLSVSSLFSFAVVLRQMTELYYVLYSRMKFVNMSSSVRGCQELPYSFCGAFFVVETVPSCRKCTQNVGKMKRKSDRRQTLKNNIENIIAYAMFYIMSLQRCYTRCLNQGKRVNIKYTLGRNSRKLQPNNRSVRAEVRLHT